MPGPEDPAPAFGLNEAYAVDGPDGNRELYAAWADTYDVDFVERTDYVYHERVANLLVDQLVDLEAPVLDVGCGTGVVGVELRRLGVSVVDGVDISPEMLVKAGAKVDQAGQVYRQLIEADLTSTIEVPTDEYPAVISAGAFTHGHLGPQSLAELLRVAAPGASCVIGINSAHFAELGFESWFGDCAASGSIANYRVVHEPVYANADGTDPNQIAVVAVFTAR